MAESKLIFSIFADNIPFCIVERIRLLSRVWSVRASIQGVDMRIERLIRERERGEAGGGGGRGKRGKKKEEKKQRKMKQYKA